MYELAYHMHKLMYLNCDQGKHMSYNVPRNVSLCVYMHGNRSTIRILIC